MASWARAAFAAALATLAVSSCQSISDVQSEKTTREDIAKRVGKEQYVLLQADRTGAVLSWSNATGDSRFEGWDSAGHRVWSLTGSYELVPSREGLPGCLLCSASSASTGKAGKKTSRVIVFDGSGKRRFVLELERDEVWPLLLSKEDLALVATSRVGLEVLTLTTSGSRRQTIRLARGQWHLGFVRQACAGHRAAVLAVPAPPEAQFEEGGKGRLWWITLLGEKAQTRASAAVDFSLVALNCVGSEALLGEATPIIAPFGTFSGVHLEEPYVSDAWFGTDGSLLTLTAGEEGDGEGVQAFMNVAIRDKAGSRRWESEVPSGVVYVHSDAALDFVAWVDAANGQSSLVRTSDGQTSMLGTDYKDVFPIDDKALAVILPSGRVRYIRNPLGRH